MAELGLCPHCKENSTKTKCYTRGDGKRRGVEFCMNKGCGYKADITFPELCIGSEKGGAS